MNWQLTLINNYQNSGESCVQLTHTKRENLLRSWFGPFAQQLFHSITNKVPTPVKNSHNCCLDIGKQCAQYLLVQASYQHQRCLYQYQVNQDLNNKGIQGAHELGDLLLYIRMTAQHPCHQNIEQLYNTQLSSCHDTGQALNTLLDARLIQQINYQQLTYYDKNPYPHDHVLNLRSEKLTDLTGNETWQENHIRVISKQHMY